YEMTPAPETRYEPSAPARAPVQGDPADSLYRQARAALNANNFRSAADLFSRIRSRYPKSTYIPDALYWGADSRWRQGGDARYRGALTRLEGVQGGPRNAGGPSDASRLATQIRGDLARRGDPEAAEQVAEIAGATPAPPAEPGRPAAAPAPAVTV